MSHQQTKSERLEQLRRRAEGVLQSDPQAPTEFSAEGVRRLVHDLHTHQIELEMQNEELRRTQVELLESRDRFSDLYDFAPVGYLTVSHKGLILQANLTVAEMLGVERSRLADKPLSAFIAPDDDQDEYFLRQRRLIETRARQSCELRLRKANGGLFWASLEGVVVSGAETVEPQIQWAVTGIDDRKHVEQERNRLVAELETKNAELERFAHTVSHDLKSPLFTIKGYLGLLEQDLAAGDTGSVKECLRRLASAADKVAHLLDALLELSEVGRVAGPPEDVNLADVVAETLDTLGRMISEAGARVEVVSDLPVVRADRVRIGQVVQNLVENAVKYRGAQAEPRIEIGAHQTPYETVCYVRDNGMGIDPQHHGAVFGPFVKLDRETHGTGLGLSLVKRIIEVHGGRIWVESDGSGTGTTFCFTIPSK